MKYKLIPVLFMVIFFSANLFAQEVKKEEPAKPKTQIELAKEKLTALQTKLDELSKNIKQNQDILNAQKAEAYDVLLEMNQYSYFIAQNKPKEEEKK